MNRNNGTESYVPERDALKGKDARQSRLCREDCVLLVPNERRILACRSTERADALLASLGEEEWSFLERESGKTPHLLLPREGGSVLVLGEPFAATETVLLLLLQRPAESVARALQAMGRTDFLPSPSVRRARPRRRQDEEIAEELRELLSYTDRALSAGRGVGMRTRCLLLASLAGCRLTADELPVLPDGLSTRDTLRLCILLLGLLLTLRQRDGDLRAEEEEEGYCILWKANPPDRLAPTEPKDDEPLPLLALPCFSGYRVRESENGFSVEIPMEGGIRRGRRTPLLQSGSGRERYTLTLTVRRRKENGQSTEGEQ